MTLATLEIFPKDAVRKGFQYVRKPKRAKYDDMRLHELKAAFRQAEQKATQTGKPSDVQEAEYIRQNILLIQLCRGVI